MNRAFKRELLTLLDEFEQALPGDHGLAGEHSSAFQFLLANEFIREGQSINRGTVPDNAPRAYVITVEGLELRDRLRWGVLVWVRANWFPIAIALITAGSSIGSLLVTCGMSSD